MRHFIAYHNPIKMGYPYPLSVDQRVLTNKPVKHVIGNTVWVVSFKGASRDYSLAGAFQVAEIGETHEAGFRHFVAGKGHLFSPWPSIKDMEWFQEIMRVTGHFGLGLHDVKESAVIAGLIETAAECGYNL